jgi:SOS-response transcriptional repressor LexA
VGTAATVPKPDLLDPEIRAIADALRERGWPNAELGRQLGLDSSQVSRIFSGRRRLQRHEMAIVREWLWPGSGGGGVAGRPHHQAESGMVPLYGFIGAAGDGRIVFADQSVRGYVPLHPAQQGLVNSFALEVADVSMSPRYEPGEIVYVAPNRWPARGQDCVVVTRDGAACVRRFVGRNNGGVDLSQLNPPQELTVDLSEITAIHAVVGRG